MRQVHEPAAECFACGSSDVRELHGVRDVHTGTSDVYTLLRCRQCGATALGELPSPARLAAIYPDDYYSYGRKRSGINALEVLLRLTYRRHAFRPRFHKLLEIGSGKGDFLKTLARTGRVVGLERSSSAREAAAAQGVSVVVGDVDDSACFAPASFDYIYLNHAFEHLLHPDRAMKSIHDWLEPGGKLFIGIPNANAWVARVFKQSWYYLAPPLHITSLTPRAVRRFLRRHGFEVERISYNSDPISIPMSVVIAAGGRIDRMHPIVKLLVGAGAFACFPIAKLFDFLRAGDCIEVHARRDG